MRHPFFRHVIFIILLILLGGLTYSSTLSYPFQYDDKAFIVENKGIRDLKNIKAIWQSVLGQPSRFIGFLSFAVNYQIHQLRVQGYRIANIILHFLNGGLIYLFALQLCQTKHFSSQVKEGQKELIACLAGLIFLVHPLQTQAVTYISQRFASLATFFYLASLYAYLRGRLNHQQTRCSWPWLGLSLLFGVCGMLTKEIVVTLPVMVIFLEYFAIQGTDKRRERKSLWGLWAVVLITLLLIPAIFSFRIQSVLFQPKWSASHDGDMITFPTYLMTQARVWMTFLRLFFMPVKQNIDYDFPLSYSLWNTPTLLSLLALLALALFTIKDWKKYPWLSFGMIWFFITISANLIPRRHVIFEHKMYLSSIGLCLGVAYFIVNKFRAKGLLISAVCLLSVLSFLTYQRNQVWRSPVSLWSDTVFKSPFKYRPRINLAAAFIDEKRYASAMYHIDAAIRLRPKEPEGHNNRGLVYYKIQCYEKALEPMNQAIALKPGYYKYYNDRGLVYTRLGEYDLALKDFNRSLALRQDNPWAYRNRSDLYFAQKKYKQSLEDLNKAIQIHPQYTEAYNNRGLLWATLKQYDRALEDFQACIRLQPAFADAYNNSAFIYLQYNDTDTALKFLDQAIAIKQDYSEAYTNRAVIYRKQKKYERALADLNRSIEISPGYVQAFRVRANVFFDLGEQEKGQADLEHARRLNSKTETGP